MRINKKIKNFRLPFLLAAAFCLGWPLLANAIIAGPCANCHTMHNSQGGAAEVHLGADGGHWTSGTGGWAGPTNSTPQKNLLKSDCVGCHSSSSTDTIVTLGGVTKIPIVFNTGGPAANTELAGGNFYYTTVDGLNPGENMNNRGHNVAGIAARDPLPKAPGDWGGACGQGCHESLVDPVNPLYVPSTGENQTGCEGCHLKVGHHDVETEGGTGAGNSYRFLAGHGGTGLAKMVDSGMNTVGISFEGVNWGIQNSVDPNDRNLYMPQTAPQTTSSPSLPIGRWCAGCHGKFHAFGAVDEMFLTDNGGDRDKNPATNPWLRHPTNVDIPSTGTNEYTDPGGVMGKTYNPETGIPLARFDRFGTVVTTGDQVMCLSCHKAHASEWPDALRFDYNQNNAHSGVGRDNGCFFCHRAKDL
jgi:predicted CXXCH cytochrome family protein